MLCHHYGNAGKRQSTNKGGGKKQKKNNWNEQLNEWKRRSFPFALCPLSFLLLKVSCQLFLYPIHRLYMFRDYLYLVYVCAFLILTEFILLACVSSNKYQWKPKKKTQKQLITLKKKERKKRGEVLVGWNVIDAFTGVLILIRSICIFQNEWQTAISLFLALYFVFRFMFLELCKFFFCNTIWQSTSRPRCVLFISYYSLD